MISSIKTCTSTDCPERFSICCKAISKAVTGGEGTSHFACSQCGKEYIGGECTSENPTTEKDRLVLELDEYWMEYSEYNNSASLTFDKVVEFCYEYGERCKKTERVRIQQIIISKFKGYGSEALGKLIAMTI